MLNCCICVRSIEPQNIISYWMVSNSTHKIPLRIPVCFCCKFVCKIWGSVIILWDPEPSFLSRTVIETGSKPCVYFYSNFFSRMSDYDCCTGTGIVRDITYFTNGYVSIYAKKSVILYHSWLNIAHSQLRDR